MLKNNFSFIVIAIIILCLSCKATKNNTSVTQEDQSSIKSLDLSKNSIKELNKVAGLGIEELIEILDLDIVQTEELIGAFASFDDQRENVALIHQGDREEMRKAMLGLQQDHNSKMKLILTKEQFALYKLKTQATSQNKKAVIR